MARRRFEDQIQRAVVQYLKVRAQPDCVWLHPANGGFRRRPEAAILQAMGVVAGSPDLLLFRMGRAFAIEIKTESGKLSEAQKHMIDRLDRAGVFVRVCYGLDQCLAALEEWSLLRGSAQ